MDTIQINTSDLQTMRETLILALRIVNKTLHEEKAEGVSTPSPRKGKKGRASPNQESINNVIQRRVNRYK